MAVATRIYVVTQEGAEPDRLVRARSQAQAVNHCAKSQFKATVATQDDIVECMTNGCLVEDASGDPDDEDPAVK
jgi:hypothetical protein